MSKKITIKSKKTIDLETMGKDLFDFKNFIDFGYKKIVLDFSELEFITPSGICYVAMTKEIISKRLETEDFDIIYPKSNNTKNYLVRMGLTKALHIQGKENKTNDCSDRLLELNRISMTDNETKAAEKIKTVISAQLNDKEVLEAVGYSVAEIIDNTIRHSNSEFGGFVCAQTYPQKNSLEICIIDSGIGIKQTLLEENNIHKSIVEKFQKDYEFIDFALGKGVTSKTNLESGHSGEGLFFAKEYVRLNGGRMKIISDEGMLYIDKFANKELFEINNWPGTIVMIELNLQNKISLKEIFDKEFPPLDQDIFSEMF